MRIALLHYSAPPVVGGVESVMGQHARLMADAGHQVRIIAGRGAALDPRMEFVQLPLVDSRDLQALAAKSALDRGEVPADFEALVNRVQSALGPPLADVDLLIAHNVYSLHKNLALTAALRNIASRERHPRLVLWHHDLAWSTPRYQAEMYPGYPWDLLRTPLPGARQVVVSEARRQELAALLQIPADEITVVPNGIDVAAFLKLGPETVDLYKQLDLGKANPLLLLPARITPRKNIELALRVLADLHQTFPSAALIVTGPLGPHSPSNAGYAEGLRTLRHALGLENSAHFLVDLAGNELSHAAVADLYRLADALFFPSREEGFGIPLLEAALANLPVFCADIPPLRRLGGDQAHYFSPEADPAAVADLLAEKLGSDPRFLLRTRVRDGYTWESVYEQHVAPLLNGQQTG
jgi:glycosyltransferase involved in cell wall biosynthesis